MLNIFMELLLKAHAVVVTEPVDTDAESDSPAKPPSQGTARRVQFATAPVTGQADNEVVNFTWVVSNLPMGAVLTEEGIRNGRFDSKTQEFRVFEKDGDELRVRLLVDGQTLCPPDGFEKFQGPHFLVVQEGGSSAEFYVHSLQTRAAAVKHQHSCGEAAYRTTEIVEVPASLADHPDFYDVVEKLINAMQTLESRSPDEE